MHNFFLRTALLTVLTLSLGLLSACAASRVVGSGSSNTPPPPLVLGTDDLVEIRVYLEDSLTGEYRVDDSGAITFPLLGAVRANGLAPGALADSITARLKDGYLNNPQVSVTVIEFNSRQVSVIGEVTRPGRYPYRDGLTLVEAIAEAGGTTDQAQLVSMQVTRTVLADSGPSQRRFEVPFRDITLGRSPDFDLLPGDMILVQESAVR